VTQQDALNLEAENRRLKALLYTKQCDYWNGAGCTFDHSACDSQVESALETELQQYKEAVRLADLYLSNVYGTCPTDLGFLTEDPDWCAEHCTDKIEGCWSRYLLLQAKGGQS
jgi:hypothetical protein